MIVLGPAGVDNGQIWFDHVRVPRWMMLDRYAQVRQLCDRYPCFVFFCCS